MLQERIEHRWIAAFRRTLELCGVGPGDEVAVLAETQSRPILPDLAELALHAIGARPFRVTMPSPAVSTTIPLRSTGTSLAMGGHQAAIAGLAAAKLVVDCTAEGLLHAPERAAIMARGARIMMISNEHPEVLERLQPDPAIGEAVRAAVARARAAKVMRVTSPAGTELTVRLPGAPVRAAMGFTSADAPVAYWPAGLVAIFPVAGSVEGQVVLAPGDANLTFKEYCRERTTLTIERDRVTAIAGDGMEAAMLRRQLEDWEEPEAWCVSHVGWGLNPKARWDGLMAYDKAQVNGTELRAFAGNFLFSTGSNEHAGRFCRGHFDFPMRGCTVELDGVAVVKDGRPA
ncbi:MAG: 2,5-dihydroxypyridine 5,6-dioxygenase [Acetobacteraceae bacterium]|nr:2,5-dihydroxypyridine 5,6-dioxygenase [Acetobacteraceae bacterium]